MSKPNSNTSNTNQKMNESLHSPQQPQIPISQRPHTNQSNSNSSRPLPKVPATSNTQPSQKNNNNNQSGTSVKDRVKIFNDLEKTSSDAFKPPTHTNKSHPQNEGVKSNKAQSSQASQRPSKPVPTPSAAKNNNNNNQSNQSTPVKKPENTNRNTNNSNKPHSVNASQTKTKPASNNNNNNQDVEDFTRQEPLRDFQEPQENFDDGLKQDSIDIFNILTASFYIIKIELEILLKTANELYKPMFSGSNVEGVLTVLNFASVVIDAISLINIGDAKKTIKKIKEKSETHTQQKMNMQQF